MIIGTCGFGSSGSSVITDYLSEYGNNIKVIDSIEFTWVYTIDGLIDLEFHLMHPHGRTGDSICAIKRYLNLMEKNTKEYECIGKMKKGVLKKSTENFISKITQEKWFWYDFEEHEYNRKFRHLKFRLDDHLMYSTIPKKEKKEGARIKHYPMKEVRFSVFPDNFYDAAKIHIRELIEALGAKKNDIVVLDQPFSGNNPQACFSYYENPFAIVVDRDPRDMYVFAKIKLLGRNHFMPTDDVYSFIRYYKSLRDNQPYKESNDRVFVVQFEDMVYNYDKTTEKLRKFLNFPVNPAPKSIFDPNLSINNTQVWKRFPEYNKDIEIIEKELKMYLFDFKNYGEIDLQGEMFYGKSPLNKS